MKTWTSILAAGAIVAFAVPVGNASLRDNLDHGVSTGHSIASTTGKQMEQLDALDRYMIRNVKHVKTGNHAKQITIGNGVYSPDHYLRNTPDVRRIGP
jgi:hypothetical protein